MYRVPPSILFDMAVVYTKVFFYIYISSSPRKKSHSNGSQRILRPVCKIETYTGHG